MQYTKEAKEAIGLDSQLLDDLLAILTEGLTKDGSHVNADLAFHAIFQQREQLTVPAQETFAKLTCDYFSQVLPARDVVYRSKSLSPISPQLARTRLLLAQCQQLGWYFKYKLPAANWLNFCQTMGEVLFKQGYYEPESWLDLPSTATVLAVSDTSAPLDLAQSIADDPALYFYHDQLVKRISTHLRASLDISSGLISTAKSKKNIVVGATADSTSILSTAIPILGGLVGAGIKTAGEVYDMKNQLAQYRQAVKQATWVITSHDCDCLAQELALALTLARKPLLMRGPTLTLSQKARHAFQQFREDQEFSDAQRLALQDHEILIELLREHTPAPLAYHNPNRIHQLAQQLMELWKKNQNQSIYTLPAEAKTPTPTEAKRVAMDLAAPAIKAPLRSAIDYWQEHRQQSKLQQSENITRLVQQIGPWVINFEKHQRLEEWMNAYRRLTSDETPSTLTQTILLHQQLLETLVLPLRWSPEEYDGALRHLQELWMTKGTVAIYQLPVTEWQEQHAKLLRMINHLEQQTHQLFSNVAAAGELVSVLRSQYHEFLQQQLAPLKTAQQARQQRLDQHQVDLAPLTKRYTEWSQRLNSWLTELAPAKKEIKYSAPPEGHAVDYADPDQCQQTLIEAWRSNTFSLMVDYYMAHHRTWQQALAQNRSNTQMLHANLVLSLQQAKTALAKCYQEAQEFADEPAIIIETRHVQISLFENRLHELLLTARRSADEAAPKQTAYATKPTEYKTAITETKHSKIQIAVKPEQAQETEMEQPFWQSLRAIVVTAEESLGETPCAFSVVAWNETLPGCSVGEWRIGLLLADPSHASNKYWSVLQRLLSAHAVCLSLPIGMHWHQERITLIEEHDLSAYLKLAREVTTSHTQAEQARLLWPRYQTQMLLKLQEKQAGIYTTRLLGHGGLNRYQPPALSPFPAGQHRQLAELLVKPLLEGSHALGLYFGLPPSTPAQIYRDLGRAESPHLAPAFIQDLKAAFDWAQSRLLALEKAWQQQQPPVNLNPGEVVIADAETSVPDAQKPFYLFPNEQVLLQRHHQYTLTLLQSTQPVWDLRTTPPAGFDPLRYWFDYQLYRIQTRKVPSDQINHELYTLARISVDREWLDLDDQTALLQAIPSAPWRSCYVQHLQALLPVPQPALIHHLRHHPNAKGSRLNHYEEQRAWQQQQLPQLWRKNSTDIGGNFPADDQPVEMKRTHKFPPPQISVARRVMQGGQREWVVETHTLRSDIATQLFTEQGLWRPKRNPKGNHQVYDITLQPTQAPDFYVKAYPESTMDWMVTELDRRLGINGTPMVELVKFHHGGQTSAALISSAIAGKTLQDVLDEDPEQLAQLDFASFIQTLLRVMIISPEDDKADDYFLVMENGKWRLTRIDNERAFFKATRAGQGLVFKVNTLQVKSIIYCLEQMRMPWPKEPAVQAVLNDFLQLQPKAVILDILQKAEQFHSAWKLLFNEKELETHFDCNTPGISLPVMCLPEGLARNLITHFTSLQTEVRFSQDSRFGHHTLDGLSLLQTTYPELIDHYSSVHLERGENGPTNHHHVAARFERVTAGEYRRDAKGIRQTKPLSPIAFQKSMGLPKPLDKATLRQVWTGNICSPQQELAAFKNWGKDQLHRLYRDMLLQRPQTIAEFQGLPLKHQLQLWKKFKKKLIENILTDEQQIFLLKAMVGTPWQDLDLSAFAPNLVTPQTLLPLLQSAGKHLLALNLSGCTKLTPAILQQVKAHCPHLRHLQVNNQPHVSWATLEVPNFLKLVSLECQNILHLSSLRFGDLPRLRSIVLKNNPALTLLANQGIGFIASTEAWRLPQLQRINIENCKQLRLLHLEIAKPAEVAWIVSGCPQLQFPLIEPTTPISPAVQGLTGDALFIGLNFFWKKFSAKTQQRLLQSLNTSPPFIQLQFSAEEITNSAIPVLTDALEINTPLTHLIITDNNINNLGTQALARVVNSQSSLRHLELSDNTIDAESAKALTESLEKHRALTSLSLRGNMLSAAGAHALSKALESHPPLLTLDLTENNIGSVGAKTLAEVLKTRPPLLNLNLSNNLIGQAGAEALADALTAKPSLAKLCLNHNDIGFLGVHALAESLKTHPPLLRLELNSTRLTDAAAQTLAEALSTKPPLTQLHLERNAIGAAGLQALADALASNMTLTELMLHHNPGMTAAIQKSIDESLTRNRQAAIQLFNAIHFKSLDDVKLLQSQGVSVNQQMGDSEKHGGGSYQGYTPLMIAVRTGQLEIVNHVLAATNSDTLLRKAGNKTDFSHQTALEIALTLLQKSPMKVTEYRTVLYRLISAYQEKAIPLPPAIQQWLSEPRNRISSQTAEEKTKAKNPLETKRFSNQPISPLSQLSSPLSHSSRNTSPTSSSFSPVSFSKTRSLRSGHSPSLFASRTLSFADTDEFASAQGTDSKALPQEQKKEAKETKLSITTFSSNHSSFQSSSSTTLSTSVKLSDLQLNPASGVEPILEKMEADSRREAEWRKSSAIFSNEVQYESENEEENDEEEEESISSPSPAPRK